jgi:hypothetical protein
VILVVNAMDNVEMRLLHGRYIDIDKICKVYPLTLREIDIIGFDKYNEYISALCVSSEDIKELYGMQEEVTTFQFIILNCKFSKTEEYKSFIINALQCFLREPIHFNELGFFYLREFDDGRFINEDVFEQIQEVIMKQNMVYKKKEEYNPGNERAKKFIEALKKKKKNKPKIPQDYDILSIVSGLAWKSPNINILNVWELTIYQLYDGYYRLELINNYDNTMHGLYAGTVDKDSVDLKKLSWIKKIVNKEED